MIIKAAFGMESELPSNLTIECVEQAINDINTESDLAALFAVVENKAWWIEDEAYDFDVGTEEYKKVKEKIDLWFVLANKLRRMIFEIPKTKQILVLEPFMKRNGFKDAQGWWIETSMAEK